MNECKRKAGTIEPCQALARATESRQGVGMRKGLFLFAVKDQAVGVRMFFAIKSGDATGDGLILNYCPFCGVEHKGATVAQAAPGFWRGLFDQAKRFVALINEARKA